MLLRKITQKCQLLRLVKTWEKYGKIYLRKTKNHTFKKASKLIKNFIHKIQNKDLKKAKIDLLRNYSKKL